MRIITLFCLFVIAVESRNELQEKEDIFGNTETALCLNHKILRGVDGFKNLFHKNISALRKRKTTKPPKKKKVSTEEDETEEYDDGWSSENHSAYTGDSYEEDKSEENSYEGSKDGSEENSSSYYEEESKDYDAVADWDTFESDVEGSKGSKGNNSPVMGGIGSISHMKNILQSGIMTSTWNKKQLQKKLHEKLMAQGSKRLCILSASSTYCIGEDMKPYVQKVSKNKKLKSKKLKSKKLRDKKLKGKKLKGDKLKGKIESKKGQSV